jgi:hypothetical protein
VTVRAQGDRGWKAVQVTDAAVNRCIDHFARGEIDLTTSLSLPVDNNECGNENSSATTEQQLQGVFPAME